MENSSNSSENFTHHPVATSGLTRAELWFQLIFAYGIVGLASILLNLLIAVCVWRIEKLHSRFFVFIFSMSLARILYGCSHITLSTYRGLRTVGMVAPTTSTLICHSVNILTYFAATWDLLLLLLLVLDRAISLAFPMIYRNMSKRQAIYICIGSFFAVIGVRLLPSYDGVSASQTVACVNSYYPVSLKYAWYAKYLDLGLSVAILLAYVVLIGLAYYRTHGGQSNLNETALKKSMRVLPYLKMQLVMHCCLVVTSRSMQLAAGYIGEETVLAQRMVAYYAEICSLDVLVNGFVFYWKHPKLWYASLKMLFGERGAKFLTRGQAVAPANMIAATSIAVSAAKPSPRATRSSPLAT